MHLIAGTAFGRTAPTPTYSPMFYLAVEMEAGAAFELPLEHEERAVYVVSGDVEVAGVAAARASSRRRAGERRRCASCARSAARVMLLGGAPLDGDRHIWWNFVASSRELMDEAGGALAERAASRPCPAKPSSSRCPNTAAERTTFVP